MLAEDLYSHIWAGASAHSFGAGVTALQLPVSYQFSKAMEKSLLLCAWCFASAEKTCAALSIHL